MNVNRGLLRGLVVAAASAALMVPSAAFAQGHGAGQGGPPSGHGGGQGETETTTNNLSTPTIMVNGEFANVTCGSAVTPSTLVTPTGEPQDGFPVNPANYYYVQGVNSWQAQCFNASSASATAAWGDNLTGSARLTVGHPIRVELGLDNSGTPTAGEVTSMQGYGVVKLDPNALDRESPYGVLATGSTAEGFSASPATFTPTEWRVYDGGATFSICLDGTNTCPVAPGTEATAEINATGNVVYGYNLKVPQAGMYKITFTMPNVTFTGADAGEFSDNTASVTITVPSGGGGVGRGGGAGGGGHHGGGGGG